VIVPRKKSIRAFTLVEVIVVIFIVAILAAIAIPIYRAKVDKAKWSEGKAFIGSIATAIRTWCAEKGVDYPGPFPSTLEELGFSPGDCTGTYFAGEDFSVVITRVSPVVFSITCTPATRPDRPAIPASVTMAVDSDGSLTWTES
jgi:prepilin-type N-terminal cleavage/methylation domain-containing protein